MQSDAGQQEQPSEALSVLQEMSEAEQGVRMGTLVVVAPDGAPLPQRVWCATVEGGLYLAVAPLSAAARHLQEDGRVCLLLGHAGEEGETVTGTAEAVPSGAAAAQEVLARLAGRVRASRMLFRVTPAPLAPVEAVEDPADRRLMVQHIFSDLPQTVAKAMAHRLRYESFEPGALVVRQGTRGDRFFIVVDGEVEVIQEQEGAADRLLTVLGPGESFGESALLLDTPRTATVRARTPLRVLALDKHTFDQVVLLSGEDD